MVAVATLVFEQRHDDRIPVARPQLKQ
jgi:hypothetical protein